MKRLRQQLLNASKLEQLCVCSQGSTCINLPIGPVFVTILGIAGTSMAQCKMVVLPKLGWHIYSWVQHCHVSGSCKSPALIVLHAMPCPSINMIGAMPSTTPAALSSPSQACR